MIRFCRITTLLLLAVFCWLAGARATNAENRGNQPRSLSVSGIYILNPVDKEIPEYVLRLPHTAGVSLRASWKRLAPAPDRFDWSYLDSQMEAAGTAGKQVTLRILPGIHAPDWLYEQGAAAFEFTDSNPRHPMFGHKLRLPLPWDETFLKAWGKLIAALGARYGGNPHLAILHVTGPNRNSAEMHLPHLPEDRQHWQEIGYTPEKLTRAWQRCIDAWAQALPHVRLSLNLSPVIFDDSVMRTVAQYGHEKYGRRFLLQNNALTAKPEHRRPDFALLQEYARKTTVGFQMLGMATAKTNPRQGDLKQSIDNGLKMGAGYFEIYPHDAKRLPLVIEYGADKLPAGEDLHNSPEQQAVSPEALGSTSQ